MAFNRSFEMVGPYASSAVGAAGSTTENINIPATGNYTISWKIEAPLPSQGGGDSGIVVRIRNSTTASNVFLGTAGLCGGGQVSFPATADDVIAVNLSSTAAADLTSLNAVKGTFAISSGV